MSKAAKARTRVRKIDDRVGVLVRMPPELKEAIVAEVERQNAVNAVAKAFEDMGEGLDAARFDEWREQLIGRAPTRVLPTAAAVEEKFDTSDWGTIVKKVTQTEENIDATNMNDVCVNVIAREFKVKYEPTARHGNPRDADKVLLRMDDQLKRKVQSYAFDQRTNTNDTIVRLLAKEFNIPVVISEGRRATPFGGGPRRIHSAAA